MVGHGFLDTWMAQVRLPVTKRTLACSSNWCPQMKQRWSVLRPTAPWYFVYRFIQKWCTPKLVVYLSIMAIIGRLVGTTIDRQPHIPWLCFIRCARSTAAVACREISCSNHSWGKTQVAPMTEQSQSTARWWWFESSYIPGLCVASLLLAVGSPYKQVLSSISYFESGSQQLSSIIVWSSIKLLWMNY